VLTEAVVVEGATEIVQTQKTAVVVTLTQKQIISLPLPGRGAFDLVTYMPGVTTADGSARGPTTTMAAFTTTCGATKFSPDLTAEMFQGTATTYKMLEKGKNAYNVDWSNVAPSLGAAWTVGAEKGFLHALLGSPGDSVLRGGASLAYQRGGMSDFTGPFGANPGVSIDASRNQTNGNLGTLLLLLTGSDRPEPDDADGVPDQLVATGETLACRARAWLFIPPRAPRRGTIPFAKDRNGPVPLDSPESLATLTDYIPGRGGHLDRFLCASLTVRPKVMPLDEACLHQTCCQLVKSGIIFCRYSGTLY